MCSLEPVPREQVEILLPPPCLRDHVACAIVRRVAAGLHAAPLRADVQANRYACLNLVVEGAVEVAGRSLLPRICLAGPFTAPLATQVQGAVRSVSIVMQPWLAGRSLGTDTSAIVDRIIELDVQQPGLNELFDAAARLTQDVANAGAFWSALDAWLGDPSGAPQLAFDTLLSKGVQAAAAECGLSERHYRRRFVREMGLRPGAWVRIRRLEHVMRELAVPQEAQGSRALSELALDAGYADQAHMSREARALAGHSPGGLHGLFQAEVDAPWPLQAARPISSRPRE